MKQTESATIASTYEERKTCTSCEACEACRASPPVSLDCLPIDEVGHVIDIDRQSPMYGRMLDMGIRPGVYIRCERISLFGDPVAYRLLRMVYPPKCAEDVETLACHKTVHFISESLVSLRRVDARAVHIERVATGREASDSSPEKSEEAHPRLPLVVMAGNPNVGKSSLYNALTGHHRHTGNWTGKTVDCAVGLCRRNGRRSLYGRRMRKSETFYLADLPGSYSLDPHSPEEDETLQFLLREPIAAAVVVCEPSALRRNLPIAYQIAALPRRIPIILCVNLMDEAERHGLSVDREALEAATGFRVVLTSAKRGVGLDELVTVIREVIAEQTDWQSPEPKQALPDCIPEASTFCEEAERAAYVGVRFSDKKKTHRAESMLERLLTGRFTAIPLAMLLLTLVFWLTIQVSNRPSAWLSEMFVFLERHIRAWPLWEHLPAWCGGILLDGVYATLTRVIAVMLPPMSIFFPLFTLMEDFGLLPRIAFNFDRCFKSCHACGKQALTMCMGFGCNAVGVTGCRIIDTPRERKLAILTNSLVPCNGKFPTLIAMISLMTATGIAGKHRSYVSALMLTLAIVISVLATWLCSRLLSATILRVESGHVNGFVMEMPPFRVPNVGRVLIRSLTERTVFILGRAVMVAAPAGAVLWLLTHIEIAGSPLLTHLTSLLNPIGWLLCVDGAILAALLLSAPANELTLPILLMIYTSGEKFMESDSALLGQIVSSVGWTPITIMAFTALFMFHAPCTTTLLTIRRETGKTRWALAAAIIPSAVGILICLLLRLIQYLIDFFV